MSECSALIGESLKRSQQAAYAAEEALQQTIELPWTQTQPGLLKRANDAYLAAVEESARISRLSKWWNGLNFVVAIYEIKNDITLWKKMAEIRSHGHPTQIDISAGKEQLAQETVKAAIRAQGVVIVKAALNLMELVTSASQILGKVAMVIPGAQAFAAAVNGISFAVNLVIGLLDLATGAMADSAAKEAR